MNLHCSFYKFQLNRPKINQNIIYVKSESKTNYMLLQYKPIGLHRKYLMCSASIAFLEAIESIIRPIYRGSLIGVSIETKQIHVHGLL